MTTTPSADHLAARYGSATPPHRRRQGRFLLIITAALGIGVIIWMGIRSAQIPVRWSDVGFVVHHSQSVEATFEVIATPGTPVTCTIDALAPNYSQVGTQTVDLAASKTLSTRYSITIPTAERATTATVVSCAVDE